MANQDSTVWIAVDGIDATGKSTVVQMAGREIEKAGYSVSLQPEFSPTSLGLMLTEIVTKKNFLTILDEMGSSLWSDTLSLFADLCVKHVLAVGDSANVVLSDRGAVSAVAYQAERFLRFHGREIQDSLVGIVALTAAVPALHIVLIASEEVVCDRLTKRSGTTVPRADLDFLNCTQKRCIDVAKRLGPAVFIDTDGRDLLSIASEIAQITQEFYVKMMVRHA